MTEYNGAYSKTPIVADGESLYENKTLVVKTCFREIVPLDHSKNAAYTIDLLAQGYLSVSTHRQAALLTNRTGMVWSRFEIV